VFDTEAFLLRLRSVVQRIHALGLHGLDADALALDLLFPVDADAKPSKGSRHDIRSKVGKHRLSEVRRHGREHRCSVPEGGTGLGRQSIPEVEALEVRDAVSLAFREAGRYLPLGIGEERSNVWPVQGGLPGLQRHRREGLGRRTPWPCMTNIKRSGT